MCLSTVYIERNHCPVEVMKNVAHMIYQNGGFLLIGLLGDEKRVKGKIKSIDFIDQHSVVLTDQPTDSKK